MDRTKLTSGKVPLEKTLQSGCVSKRMLGWARQPIEVAPPTEAVQCGEEWGGIDSHQQASLAAGTVADDDQLSADLGSHGCWAVMFIEGSRKV